MTKEPVDTAAEWKRQSGVWHYWAEKSWPGRKSDPFMRRIDDDNEQLVDRPDPAGGEQPHSL